VDTRHLPKAGALPDCATPRNGGTPWVSLGFLVCRRPRRKSKNERFGNQSRFLRHQSDTRFPHVAGLFLAAALAFDPHVLLLSWSAERQERVPATSAETCRAAIDAIAAGRWLADDPPVAMACRQGSAFAPGEGCIVGHNCRGSGAR